MLYFKLTELKIKCHFVQKDTNSSHIVYGLLQTNQFEDMGHVRVTKLTG